MDCIQTTAPGSAILPIATYDDVFDGRNDDGEEAKRRNRVMIKRLKEVEEERVKDLKAKLEAFRKRGERGTAKALYLDKLLELRPNIIVGEDENDPVIRISCDINRKLHFQKNNSSGFDLLTKRMVEVTSMKKKSRNGRNEEPLFLSLGSNNPQVYTDIKKLISKLQKKCPFIEYEQFVEECKKNGIKGIDLAYISDALHYFSGIGIIIYFGSDSALRRTQASDKSGPHSYLKDDDYDDIDKGYERGSDTESGEGKVLVAKRCRRSAPIPPCRC